MYTLINAEILNNDNLFLGTAVKVLILLESEDLDSGMQVQVQVEDSSGSIVQQYADATYVAEGIYEFLYQSSITGNPGSYETVIKVVNGLTTTIQKLKFDLKD